MGRAKARLWSFCHGRVATRAARNRLQRASSKAAPRGVDGNAGRTAMDVISGGGKSGGARRVMVVADAGAAPEAMGALQWALSQAVRSNDTVVLLSVVRPGRDGGGSCVKVSKTRSYEHLGAMRSLCESSRPELKVELCMVEAEERGPAVVEAARRQGISLLVFGQKRRAAARWLLRMWPGGRWRRGGGSGTMEYCIHHAPCMTLGVRRRSSGGYLITSKSHKNFWLLA